MTPSSELSVEGTASVKDEMLDEQALAIAAEAYEEANGLIGGHEQMRQALKAYLAAAPSRDQVTMGALRVVALEWTDSGNGQFDAPGYRIETGDNGKFYVRSSAATQLFATIEFTSSLAEAKAAAQVDFEKRILSALASSLVPTAEQGVVALNTEIRPETKAALDAVDDSLRAGAALLASNHLAGALTPPIAGAGEELARRAIAMWRDSCGIELIESVDILQRHIEAAIAASLSQLYSRIGEIQRERDEWQERALTCENSISKHEADEARWSREAVEARLAEAREALVACDRQLVNMFRAACPHGNYGDGQTGGNRFADNDEAVIRARSFHSPKEPDGGGE